MEAKGNVPTNPVSTSFKHELFQGYP